MFHEVRETLHWAFEQLKRWWMGEEHVAKREALERRKQKQRQKEILRRLRGVS